MLSKNRYNLIVLCLVFVLGSCTSNKNILVKDDSSLSSSRVSFFNSLNDSITSRNNSIHSYYSRKINISADGIPLYKSVNASLSIDNDNNIKSRVYLPFPVIEVAKISITSDRLIAESKPLNVYYNTDKYIYVIKHLIKSSLIGSIPEVYNLFGDNDFSKFDVHIENNKYVMSRFVTDNKNIRLIVNSDMSLSSINAVIDNINLSFDCSNYSRIDGFDIPLSILIRLNNGKDDFKAQISIKYVSLNTNSVVDF